LTTHASNIIQVRIALESILYEYDPIGICLLTYSPDSRPLIVQFASYTSKNLIMESLYKLKHAAQKLRNVIVAHDMTKLEREECRRLVEEAKAKEEEDDSGKYLYRVRGPPGGLKIVKIRLCGLCIPTKTGNLTEDMN